MVIATWAPAQAFADNDAFQFFQEEAQVVTAARRPQSIRDVPEAVDVITSDDIRASGATTIADLLRFRVGMDVLDARATDGTRNIVSVRGFPQEYVHNLQVLLDGRSVYEPISTGVFWDKLPIAMEDIDRIEIIRGPNAALYGSGAGLGVINIITKKPEAKTSADLKVQGGTEKLVQTSEALESGAGRVAYRVSHSFEQQEGFPLASGSDDGTDFLHSNKGNARVHWTLSPASDLELFAGGAWVVNGTPDAPQIEDRYRDHFEMLRFSQKIGSASTIELMSARNNYIADQTPVYPSGTGQFSVLQYDEEALQRWQWWDDRAHTTYGVNYRHAVVNSPFLFAGNPDQSLSLWNGYVDQSLKIASSFSLNGGISWESSNVGADRLQKNYQVAALWSPRDTQAFRASYAVAHTIPGLFNVAAHDQFNAVILSVGNPALKPQTMTTYEIGHRGNGLDNHLSVDTSLYYTVVKNIETTIVQSQRFSPTPAITLGSSNLDRAIARGVETEAKYYFTRKTSAYANYTYEYVTDWVQDAGQITRNTPDHKINVGGTADLTHGFTGSVNLGYKDSYYITSIGRSVSAPIPAHWRMDVRLAYALPSFNDAEIFLAGQNLLESHHVEFPDGLTVSRMVEGGVRVHFGGLR